MGMGLGTLGSRFGRLGNAPSKGVGGRGNDYYSIGALNGPQSLADVTTPGNFTCSNCSAVADVDHFFQGSATTKISVTGSQASFSFYIAIDGAKLAAQSGRIGVALNLGAASNTATVQFEVGDGTSFTNKWLKFPQAGATGVQNRELSGYWNNYYADVTTGTPTGSPVLASMTHLRITIGNVGTNTAESPLWVGKIAALPATKAKVIIVWDDLHDSFFTDGYLEYVSRGLPATCAVAKSKIDSGGTLMTLAHLTTILNHSSGLFVAVNHSDTHVDLSGLSTAAALADIASGDTYLQTLPRYDRRFFVYPFGGHTIALDAAMHDLTSISGSGYKMAREVGASDRTIGHHWLDEGLTNMRCPATVAMDSGTTLVQAKARVDNGVTRGELIFIMGHKLAGAAGADQWATSDHTALLDYLVTLQTAGSLDVVSWGSYYDSMKPSGRTYAQPTARTAPYYVKACGATNPNATGQATAVVTFTNEVPVGDFVSVAITFGLGSTPTATLVDTAGNTWTADKKVDMLTGATPHTWIYSTVVTTKIVNGDTLTLTPSASINYPVMDVRHFAQAPTKTLIADQTASATGTSTAPAAGSMTPTNDNELIIAAVCADTTTYVATTMTELVNVNNTTKRTASQYQVQGTAAAVNAQGTLGASKAWAMAAVSYKQTP
jgi:hypothetical protein